MFMTIIVTMMMIIMMKNRVFLIVTSRVIGALGPRPRGGAPGAPGAPAPPAIVKIFILILSHHPFLFCETVESVSSVSLFGTLTIDMGED